MRYIKGRATIRPLRPGNSMIDRHAQKNTETHVQEMVRAEDVEANNGLDGGGALGLTDALDADILRGQPQLLGFH